MLISRSKLLSLLLCLISCSTFVLAQDARTNPMPEQNRYVPPPQYNAPPPQYNITHPQYNPPPVNYQPSCHQGCPCGCPCGPGCSCGCTQGNPCHCHDHNFGYGPECNDNCFDPYYYNDNRCGCCDNMCDDDCEHARKCGACGVWMPEMPPLFRPFAADPRQITYSVGWRFDDQALTKNVIDVSYFDSFPVYRWCNIWPYCGQLQIDIEGALWACFNPSAYSAPLLNADYYVGFPITYAVGPWSFRLRGFHISSHVGDEFILHKLGFDLHRRTSRQQTHGRFDRRNPSAEFLDFFVSYELTDDIRIYDGLGVVLAQDDSFRRKRFYTEGGLELRLHELGFLDCCNRLYGTPFFAMHYRWQADFKKHVDMTYVLGYEFGKLSGLQRRLRAFIEYHDGYSAEGQFCREATNYFSVRVTYGF